MMTRFCKQLLRALALISFVGSVQASMVMPDLFDVPAGWSTDRYAPASFANVGDYQGRNNVLGIEISAAGDLGSRPAANQSTFYNTQGAQHAVSGGAGSVLAADLFVERIWGVSGYGPIRTDMWAVASNGSGVTDYGIIGFTNYGGNARFRIWDADTSAGWVDLAIEVLVEEWSSFAIALTDTSLDYFVNGVKVYSDSTIGADRFSAVIMQAYNFADPLFSDLGDDYVTEGYVAHWANASESGLVSKVSEPGSLALLGLALVVVGSSLRRKTH